MYIYYILYDIVYLYNGNHCETNAKPNAHYFPSYFTVISHWFHIGFTLVSQWFSRCNYIYSTYNAI
jgi:hypothetical protein